MSIDKVLRNTATLIQEKSTTNAQLLLKVYLLLLISLTVSAKKISVSNSNFETTLTNTTCTLNVTIGSTLDTPTSTFFVGEEVLNGTAPYTYFLDGNPSPNGKMFNGLTLNSGIHTVTVKDANDCTGTGTFTVENPPLSLTAMSINPNCSGPGSITCTPIGGVPPYTYSIYSNETIINSLANTTGTISFTNLDPGMYQIHIMDAIKNFSSTIITLTEPTPVSASIIHTNVTCNKLNNGTITIIPAGGSSPYMFSINGGITFRSTPVFNDLAAGIYNIIVKGGICTYEQTITVTEPELLTASASVENQTITINAAGGSGSYEYSFDNSIFSASNLFSIGNNNYGYYSASVRDSNGCLFTIPDILVTPSAPLVNSKKTLDIKFNSGQTLGDIIIEGQNIKWYSSTGNTNKKLKAPEPTLPLSTVLKDNTTYYASQTINGYESKERLAVTTKLSLSTADFVFPNFKLYPNPVKNILTISNASTIDEVTFISIKGEILLTKQINSLNSEIDLSHFSKGIYFLKIKSEGTEKTVKIIKE